MKRLVLFLLCLATMNMGWAQKREGEFSFIPRVGLNLSNLGDMDITLSAEDGPHNIMASKKKPDFMVGADVEYQVRKALGISIGAYYSRQGCRWSDYSTISIDKDKNKTTSSLLNQGVDLQYISIPVSAKLYLSDMVSLHAGFQCSFALDGKTKSTTADLTETPDGKKTFTTEKSSGDIAELKSVVFAIPVGVAIEYESVILDARYNIPLSRFTDSLLSNGCNQVWTFSVGYRL